MNRVGPPSREVASTSYGTFLPCQRHQVSRQSFPASTTGRMPSSVATQAVSPQRRLGDKNPGNIGQADSSSRQVGRTPRAPGCPGTQKNPLCCVASPDCEISESPILSWVAMYCNLRFDFGFWKQEARSQSTRDGEHLGSACIRSPEPGA